MRLASLESEVRDRDLFGGKERKNFEKKIFGAQKI